MRSLLKTLTIISLIAFSTTTYGQNDSLKCVERSVFVQLLTDARRSVLLEADIRLCDSIVLKQKQIIENDSILIEIKEAEIERKEAEISVLNRSVRRQKRMKWLFGGVGLAGIVYFAIK